MTNLAKILEAVMTIDPGRVAIDFGGQEYSWSNLSAIVQSIRQALDELDIPREGRIGVLLRNRPAHVAAIAAILASNRCIVTLNPLLPDARLSDDVAVQNLCVVILDQDDAGRSEVSDKLQTAGSALIILREELQGIDLQRPAIPLSVSVAPGVAVEMLTSGTTGLPKRVPLTRAAFDASFKAFTSYERGRDAAEGPKLRSGVVMVVNPLTHIGGIYGCIGALLAGRKIALLERFTVEAWVEAVRRNRPKVAPAVPSALRMLLEADVSPADLSSLTAVVSGTAPLPADLVDEFLRRLGVPVLGNYGATEFAGGVAGWSIEDFRRYWSAKRGSVGRVHGNVEARVVSHDGNSVLGSGEEGVLQVRGDQLGNGGAWLQTTDRAILDADGFLFIRGRTDNAIIRGGFKVRPDDIVEALQCHPGVREAAAVGIPDDRLGAVPVAVVIPKEGREALSETELGLFLRDRLLPYQVPTAILIVKDFPRTPSMKPSAPGMRALFGLSETDA